MTEKEIIAEFDKFGYSILKSDGKFSVFNQAIPKYSIFDRRIARRVAEANSLDGLLHYANDIFCFPMWSETLEKTINYFAEAYSPSPVTPESQPEPEPVTGKEESSDPEQEEQDPPAVPEDGLFEKICPTCGKTFRTARKQARYCCPQHYPSEMKKASRNGSEVV